MVGWFCVVLVSKGYYEERWIILFLDSDVWRWSFTKFAGFFFFLIECFLRFFFCVLLAIRLSMKFVLFLDEYSLFEIRSFQDCWISLCIVVWICYFLILEFFFLSVNLLTTCFLRWLCLCRLMICYRISSFKWWFFFSLLVCKAEFFSLLILMFQTYDLWNVQKSNDFTFSKLWNSQNCHLY